MWAWVQYGKVLDAVLVWPGVATPKSSTPARVFAGHTYLQRYGQRVASQEGQVMGTSLVASGGRNVFQG